MDYTHTILIATTLLHTKMKKKYKEAFKMIEAKYKCFDSTHWLILDTRVRIEQLLEIENKTKMDEIQLATAIYMLKALSKLSIAENVINQQNKNSDGRY